MKKKLKFLLILFAVGGLFYFLNSTTKINSMDVPGYIPRKFDEFAKMYAPKLISSSYGEPIALYYRASEDDLKNIHITYHFVWEKEENASSGVKPFFSRNIYTGGLKIQKMMFGKGDIEIVSLVVNPPGKIISAEYETAENYSDADFSVKHKTIELKEELKNPLLFKVVSWNHLFELVKDGAEESEGLKLTPTYFNEKLWQEYEMVKVNETRLKKSRAHKIYEREFVE